MSARLMVGWVLAASAVTSAVGCFASPDLPSCTDDSGCPESLPVCRDGLCFHPSVDFVLPLCGGSRESGCCDMGGEEFGEGTGCLAWERVESGVVSGPTALPDDRIAYAVLGSGGDLRVVVLESDGAVALDSEVATLDEQTAGAIKELAAPAANAGGGLLVAAGNVVVDFPGGWGGKRSVGVVDSVVSGAPALCMDGRSVVLTGAGVLFRSSAGEAETAQMEIGELPAWLGPVVLAGADADGDDDAVAVPVHGGKSLAGLSLPLLDTVWEAAAADVEGGVLGLAADSGPTLFVVSGSGRVTGKRFWMVAGARDVWDVSLAGPATSNPIVAEAGRVVVAGEGGHVWSVSHATGAVGLLSGDWELETLSAIRLDGLLGGAVWEGQRGLVLEVPGASLPGGGGAGLTEKRWPGKCGKLGFSLPTRKGVVAVACDGRVYGLVAPDVAGDQPWPGLRGRWSSGCL